MPNQEPHLDDIFRALADPTRRAVLERLDQEPATTGEFAHPFDIALPSFLQHLNVLEHSAEEVGTRPYLSHLDRALG